MHSVIQANQQSVIQTATQGTMLTKGNVILLSKPNSVIQTTQGNIQTLQVVVYLNIFTRVALVSMHARRFILYHRFGGPHTHSVCCMSAI